MLTVDLYDTTSLTDVKINKTVCESGLAWPDIEIEENPADKVLKNYVKMLLSCFDRLQKKFVLFTYKNYFYQYIFCFS